MPEVTRFAPSPTGLLHLGHAYAAIFAYERARQTHGRFLVRLEDIDVTRARGEFEAALFEDLAWLGVEWETPVRRQSEHFPDYSQALARLNAMGILYPCFCTRRAIQEEIARAGNAPHGPDGAHYPGTCRSLSPQERQEKIASGMPYALRLNVHEATRQVGVKLEWEDLAKGRFVASPAIFGDVVLARKEIPVSYHLAVVVDDALQGVTLVTRGEDLLEASHLHRLLQELLKLPVPRWHHHRLVVDAEGKRLAKRENAHALGSLREAGWTPAMVRDQLMSL